MPIHLKVSIAQSTQELEEAFAIMYEHYRRANLLEPCQERLWITKWHMMPTTSNIIVRKEEEIVAAVSLFLESPIGLPIQSVISARELKKDGRIAELGAFCLDSKASEQCEPIKSALWGFVLSYASQYLGITHLITQTCDLEQKISSLDFFARETSKRQHNLYHWDLTKTELIERQPKEGEEFILPKRRFYDLHDTIWNKEKFAHFFIERTQVLAEINQTELKAVQNAYDFGAFSPIFKHYRSVIGSSSPAPRFKRFAMNSTATLVDNTRAPVHMEIHDVSLRGLRASCQEYLQKDKTYVLAVSLSPVLGADIIVTPAWSDPQSQMYGFKLENADPTWRYFIEFLESKEKKAA